MTEQYSYFVESKERPPCYWDKGANQFIITRYRDAVEVLKNYQCFSSADAISVREPNGNRSGNNTILLSDDPPRHTRIRNLVNKWFTTKELESMRLWVEHTTKILLDRIDSSNVDITASLAEPLPVMAIAHLLGVDPAAWEKFKRWSLAASGLDDNAKLSTSLRNVFAMYKFFSREIETRRKSPANDLISRMILENRDRGGLNDYELQAFCGLLLVAGNETTVNLISNMINALCDRADVWQGLRNGQISVSSVVEETLRFDSPVQFVRRIATADTAVSGCRINAGDRVGIFLAAANRDPDQFSDPDRFDPTREQSRNLAFSHGVHFCLGALLAKMEAEVVLEDLARRYTNVLRLGDSKPIYSKVMKGFETLRVKFIHDSVSI